MRIEIGKADDRVSLDVGAAHEVTISGCYLGIGVKTDDGEYGVAERDGGIVVMHGGRIVFASPFDLQHAVSLGQLGDVDSLDRCGSETTEGVDRCVLASGHGGSHVSWRATSGKRHKVVCWG